MALEAKVSLQRIEYIKRILDESPALTENPRKQDINTRLQLLESYWAKFETSHERLCDLKFEGLLTHEYFTSGYFDTCIGYYTKALSDLLTAWDQLIERYENKRILIFAQLDKLFRALPITSKSSKGLNALLCTTSEVLNAFRSLRAPVDQWNMILVRLMIRNLDNASRKA